ncbi:MAG: phytoene desaturase [Chitinophagales bacterium]|nr:phytoene desaturase [Chitinophagales bacterium]
MSKKIVVIGSGFSGLSAASNLALQGYDVTILEKNESPGGRASKFEADGFTFDMGPSWYWMPDVFETYFETFGKKPADYYDLVRLDPSYKVVFGENDEINIPASVDELYHLFESLEEGSGPKLKKFISEAAYKYKVGISDLVYRPGRSISEFIDFRLLKSVFRLQLFSSVRKHINSLFKNDRIRKILEFPVYFLGALPSNTPALYSLMNYADLVLGTWYPMGGMHKIIEGMVEVAEELGVKIIYKQDVQKIDVRNGYAASVVTASDVFLADIVVASADYHHVESKLLDENYRNYDEKYWDERVMAPSSLIYYLGVDKKVSNLKHHNLYFDKSFEKFGEEIYSDPKWPTNPLFYVCCPSKTDDSVAPEGMENLFVLIPVAPGLEDTEELREKYYNMIMERLEKFTGENIREHIIYKRSFAHSDFKDRYNAFKGNAYGLANTLKQTAIFKPSLKSKKVSNLYYTGQLTTPGPGVPPSLISGRVVAQEISKDFNQKTN